MFTTGFSQVAVVAFGVVLLKLLAAAFSESHFGLFHLVRRWDMVLLPVLTLNISFGLVRYVSFEEENSSFFLHLSLAVTGLLCLIFFPALFLFPGYFSKLLFHSPDYAKLVMILPLFLAANLLHLLAYSYFRGKLHMNTANLMRTLFFGFPLIPAGIALLVKSKSGSLAPISLLYTFFLSYSIFGIGISVYFLRKEVSFRAMKSLFRDKWPAVKDTLKKKRSLFTFSLSRVPGVFFISMVFSFPVLYAGKSISLVAAGYIGIVVSVLRLFEVFSMPFNMIFLPKFSILKRDYDLEHIIEFNQVVLDFIFTFLPFCGVIVFGLMPFVILVWFGPSYLAAADSVAIAVLFSAFYLAFALLRGILDGLFEIPYTNIISFSGFLAIGLLSILIGTDTFTLSIAFGCSLVILGLVSIGLLVRMLGIAIPWLVALKALAGAALVFLVLYFADNKVAQLDLKGLHSFALSLSYRLLLIAGLWLFYWRKTLWYKELVRRMNVPVKSEE